MIKNVQFTSGELIFTVYVLIIPKAWNVHSFYKLHFPEMLNCILYKMGASKFSEVGFTLENFMKKHSFVFYQWTRLWFKCSFNGSWVVAFWMRLF